MINSASANEHVPKIEHRIRVVKERCHANCHSLLFKRIPKLLMIYIVFNVVKMLNFFPTKGGVSETLSPKTIMSRETLDYFIKKLESAGWSVLSGPRGRQPAQQSSCMHQRSDFSRAERKPPRQLQVYGFEHGKEDRQT